MATSTESSVYNDFIISMRNDLQKQGVIDRVEYVGSRYKGTSVSSSDYDNMFVKRETTIQTTSTAYPNYYRLTRGGAPVKRDERLADFREAIKKALRNTGNARYAQITKAYGPTAVLDYRKDGQLYFSVDMVYALEVGDMIFVGKPPQKSGPREDANIWYNTVVLKEKGRMRKIDTDNGIGRMVIRRLKKLKDVEPTMHQINSYAYEQALMYLKDEYTEPLFWRENNMKTILKVVMEFMADALERGYLPAYFEKHTNAIGNLNANQREQLANRFRRLVKNPDIVLAKTSEQTTSMPLEYFHSSTFDW